MDPDGLAPVRRPSQRMESTGCSSGGPVVTSVDEHATDNMDALDVGAVQTNEHDDERT